jgi:hypothetical protein
MKIAMTVPAQHTAVKQRAICAIADMLKLQLAMATVPGARLLTQDATLGQSAQRVKVPIAPQIQPSLIAAAR